MPQYKTPGVYIEEVPKFPQSIVPVETAVPAFIGYTQKAQVGLPDDAPYKPVRISSLLEYEQYFGLPAPEKTIRITLDTRPAVPLVNAEVVRPSKYLMYYSLQMFFQNGGGSCYIISVGGYGSRDSITLTSLRKGLKAAAKCDGITLLVFPDSTNLASADDYYTLHQEALAQAAAIGDRFVVMDLWLNPKDGSFNPVQTFRDFYFGGPQTVKYGAAYYPRLFTRRQFYYESLGNNVVVRCKNNRALNGTLQALQQKGPQLFKMATTAITKINMLLPASSAVVGKYALVDNTRGVWKAPANVPIDGAVAPEVILTQQDQERLNVDVIAGKSINAIRSFPGRGAAVIWGARTIAGNDPEWRYIPVCRFFIMVEQSIRRGTESFVFEPNDANTWIRVKAMIENFLTVQWRAGALVGTTTRDAFFVKVGLNETMTEQDMLEGRMKVLIGLAVIRPGEFNLLTLVYNMQVGL